MIAAHIGLDARGLNDESNLFAQTVLANEPMVVLDASHDPRFASDDFVGALDARFWAGAPLIAEDGRKFGALGVIDTTTRPEPAQDQLESLTDLAAEAVSQLELQKSVQILTEAESDARLSASQLRALVNALPDRVFQLSRNGSYLDIHGARQACTIPPEMLLEKSVRDVASDKIATSTESAIVRALESGTTQRFEYNREDTAFEVRIAPNGLDAVVAIVRDRTEQQATEQRIRDAQEFFIQIADTMGQGLAVTDPEGCYTYVNPAYARMMSSEPAALIGRHHSSLNHLEDPESADYVWADDRLASAVQREIRLRHRSSETLFALLNITPRWEEGRFMGSVAVITDLTERKRLEDAVEGERDFVNAIADATEFLIVVANSHGRLVRFNQAGERISGYSFEELEGRPIWEILGSEETADAAKTEFQRLLAGGASQAMELPWRIRDGSTRWVAWSSAVLYNADRISHLVFTGMDVTDRRDAERAAEAALAEAERANRLKSEFFANVSHELRTPLHAVVGFCDLLLEPESGPLNPEQTDYLGEVRAAGTHLLALINDLLDLSKVDSGNVKLRPETLELRALLEACLTLVRSTADEFGVELSLEIEPGLKTVVASERQFKQVVINLLSNAVKFTPSGGQVQLLARRRARTIEIAVEDSGIGIESTDLERIFEPFAQAHNASERHKGFGLGLTLAKRLVELHGGELSVSSAPGRGSRFAMNLPHQLNQPGSIQAGNR